jgi:hypothetical protein
MMGKLSNYIRALRFWWAGRPRWPGQPTQSIVPNDETCRALEEAFRSMHKLGEAMLKQGERNGKSTK